MRQSAHHQVIPVEIFRPLPLDPLDLGRPEGRLDCRDRADRDLVMQRKNVVERAVVTLGPDMRAALRLNQLRGDAHPVARLAQRAIEHVAHA
jgi:hypothetical protein